MDRTFSPPPWDDPNRVLEVYYDVFQSPKQKKNKDLLTTDNFVNTFSN
jgi:hypothetical protein